MKIIWLKIGLVLSLLMLYVPLLAQTVVIPAAAEKASFDENVSKCACQESSRTEIHD
jgi:hypothetical protein